MPQLEIPTYSMAEVAKALNVASETVRTWIDAGELTAFNIGRGKQRPRFRITKDAIDSFIASRTVQAKPRQRQRRPMKPPHEYV